MTVRAEIIGRDPGDFRRFQIFVQPEIFGGRPHVRPVVSGVKRKISDQRDPLFFRIFLQAEKLPV